MVNIVKDSTASGVKWMVRWRAPDGTQRKKRGFAKKIDAENWAADNVTSAKAAGDYVDPRAGRTKCGDIYERWFESHRPIWKPSYTVDVDAAWRNHLSGKLADRAISGVRHSEIQAIVSDIASRRSASVTLRCFTIVKGIWQTAGSDGIIRSMRAVENISLPRKPSRKENRHYLTVPQLVRLADQCGRYRTLVLTLGLCGLRWGEAAALRPDDIDVNAGRIHVRRNVTKAGTQWVEGSPKSWEMRDVPIPAKLSPLLAAAKFGVRRDDRVFTDPDGHVLRNQTVGRGAAGWWIRALNAAGLEPMPPHDLRHTAASIAISSGANVKAVQRMLGHKSAAMTLDTYADLFDADLEMVAERVSERLPALAV